MSTKARVNFRKRESIKLFSKLKKAIDKYEYSVFGGNIEEITTQLGNILDSYYKKGSLTYPTIIKNGLLNYDDREWSVPTVRNRLLEQYSRDNAFQMAGYVQDTMIKDINNAIEKSFKFGWSKKTLVEEINKTVKDPARARRIATTETNKLINSSEYESAVEADFKEKGWLHTGAGKTNRQAHLELNGKFIGINDVFTVNGYECQYPNDPNLPLSERINCHCLLIYR